MPERTRTTHNLTRECSQPSSHLQSTSNRPRTDCQSRILLRSSARYFACSLLPACCHFWTDQMLVVPPVLVPPPRWASVHTSRRRFGDLCCSTFILGLGLVAMTPIPADWLTGGSPVPRISVLRSEERRVGKECPV